MAKTNAVWGIDIGQCSLKALRCTPGEDGKLVADAFDYIEYPKILSQPDANPEELIREALEQFLSRNEVTGDKVAISVSGQAGLSRFFKPPPVDAKTLPDIVKFEARQQIPFALEDVIWDYQQIGGKIVDGVTVDAEVGLFAMKREAVFRALKPFTDAEIEVDVVQLSPLTIYNVVLNDVLTDLPDPDEWDPSNPPESLVVVAMGTDTTDLVITDGYKLWLRNIPIGGNHFTKQLSRELKLTYAKAEHLKRNARRAEDPKTIFQAMRAVFSDLVTEIQRSISYFQGIEKAAKIGHVVMFGNASNLPGLRQYLNKHLGIEISKVNEFRSLGGSSVLGAKQFQENFLSFATCYGLCLQASNHARLETNLLPQEFVTERVIRAKKPWALAGLGALMLGFTVYFWFAFQDWKQVHPETTAPASSVSWEKARNDVKSVNDLLSGYTSTDQGQMTKLKEVHEIESAVTGLTEGRRLWSEILSTIHQLLPPYPEVTWRPVDPEFQDFMAIKPVDPAVTPYVDRPDLYVKYVETQYYPDLKTWWTDEIQKRHATDLAYLEDNRPKADPVDDGTGEGGAGAGGGAAPGVGGATGVGGAAATGGTGAADPGPQGPGWIIEIGGYHFYNSERVTREGIGAGQYVRDTIIDRILDRKTRIWLPMPPGSEQEFARFTPREMGLSYPVLVQDNLVNFDNVIIVNPTGVNAAGGAGRRPGAGTGAGGAGAGAPGLDGGDDRNGSEQEGEAPSSYPAPRYDFVVQFVWVPTTLSERLEAREEARKKREREAAQGTGAPMGGANPQAGTGQPNSGQPTNGDPSGGQPTTGEPGAADTTQPTPPAGNTDGAGADPATGGDGQPPETGEGTDGAAPAGANGAAAPPDVGGPDNGAGAENNG